MTDTSARSSQPPHIAAHVPQPAPGTVYAVLASDYDGDLFLVALTEQVDDWVVEAADWSGTMQVVDQERFVGGWYPALDGRPAWAVLDRTTWRLHVGGIRITAIKPLPDRTLSPVDRRLATPDLPAGD